MKMDMVTKAFVERAINGEPVFITEVRDAYQALHGNKIELICVLCLLEKNKQKVFKICLPDLQTMDGEQQTFVLSYLKAQFYNILSALGGRGVLLYCENTNVDLEHIVFELNEAFQIDKPRSQRQGYGRCINVIERMLDAMTDEFCADRESFAFRSLKEITCSINFRKQWPNLPFFSEKEQIISFRRLRAGCADECQTRDEITQEYPNEDLHELLADDFSGKALCGLDIGGSDIKMAIVMDGKLTELIEYDWFPAAFTRIDQIITPIRCLVRLARLYASRSNWNNISYEIATTLNDVIKKPITIDVLYGLTDTISKAEECLGMHLISHDAIGLCFPDVVVKDRIVGGEVYKTRGIRNNPDVDYELEFARLTSLVDQLKQFCKPGGVVKNINDGPMASFTAYIETISGGGKADERKGIFAHTLGTELGTGWVDQKGTIPDIPLEVYNFIIDLGSFPEKQFEADDLRSINNFNTGLPGTLQKYTSQSGLFRLALKCFPKRRLDLFRELFDLKYVQEIDVKGHKGFYTPIDPKDMRKPFLEHLMQIPERETDGAADGIFTDLGKFLAITWLETEWILQSGLHERYLFGRLVKNPVCFALIKQGAHLVAPMLDLRVADGTMANTSLMKQLQAQKKYTVAQFAQAIGAVHYGLYGLL